MSGRGSVFVEFLYSVDKTWAVLSISLFTPTVLSLHARAAKFPVTTYQEALRDSN